MKRATQSYLLENTNNIISDYIEKNQTYREICEKYNICKKTLIKILKSKNIKKLQNYNKQEIIDLYVDQGWSTTKIGLRFNMCHSTIGRILIKAGIKTKTNKDYRSYTLHTNFFEQIDSHIKAYILGFLYADGYNNQKEGKVRINIACEDEHILHDINSYIQPDRINAIKYIKEKRSNCQDISYTVFNCKKISDDLAKLGCYQGKSLTCQFPNISQEYLNSFIAGIFDGDGCFCPHYKRKKYRDVVVQICCSKDFSFQLKEKIEDNLNIATCVYPKGKINTLRIHSSKQVIKFMEWIYRDTPIFLKRKMNKFLEFKQSLHKKRKTRNPIKETAFHPDYTMTTTNRLFNYHTVSSSLTSTPTSCSSSTACLTAATD